MRLAESGILSLSSIVKDTKTGLEWVAGPDRDTNWNEAKSWVESLNIDGGGWRMPSMDELQGLYNNGAGSRNMSPLLKATGWFVWSGETKDPLSLGAWVFTFDKGSRHWSDRDYSSYRRAFAVRSRSDG